MRYHRLGLVQDVGVEDVLLTSFCCEIVLEGLDPCITDGLCKSSRFVGDLGEARALDQFEPTLHCQDVSVVLFGIASVRNGMMPIPHTYVFGKL